MSLVALEALVSVWERAGRAMTRRPQDLEAVVGEAEAILHVLEPGRAASGWVDSEAPQALTALARRLWSANQTSKRALALYGERLATVLEVLAAESGYGRDGRPHDGRAGGSTLTRSL